MELGTVLQIVLFILPGFLAIQAFLFFTPARRSDSDAVIVTSSIAATAAIWISASILLVVISVAIRGSGELLGRPVNIDLWISWLKPALKTKDVAGTDLIPAFVLDIAGTGLGLLAAHVTTGESGRLRRFQIGRVNFDLNPRVWNWFFQEPTKGRLYRIRLISGTVLIGQVTQYSIDPHDEVQELIMELYSRGEPNHQGTEAVTDAARLLLARDQIETIEQLRYRLELGPAGLGLVPVMD